MPARTPLETLVHEHLTEPRNTNAFVFDAGDSAVIEKLTDQVAEAHGTARADLPMLALVDEQVKHLNKLSAQIDGYADAARKNMLAYGQAYHARGFLLGQWRDALERKQGEHVIGDWLGKLAHAHGREVDTLRMWIRHGRAHPHDWDTILNELQAATGRPPSIPRRLAALKKARERKAEKEKADWEEPHNPEGGGDNPEGGEPDDEEEDAAPPDEPSGLDDPTPTGPFLGEEAVAQDELRLFDAMGVDTMRQLADVVVTKTRQDEAEIAVLKAQVLTVLAEAEGEIDKLRAQLDHTFEDRDNLREDLTHLRDEILMAPIVRAIDPPKKRR